MLHEHLLPLEDAAPPVRRGECPGVSLRRLPQRGVLEKRIDSVRSQARRHILHPVVVRHRGDGAVDRVLLGSAHARLTSLRRAVRRERFSSEPDLCHFPIGPVSRDLPGGHPSRKLRTLHVSWNLPRCPAALCCNPRSILMCASGKLGISMRSPSRLRAFFKCSRTKVGKLGERISCNITCK